ncbi:hypothetical protein PM082_004592 [Marasmius tenuissimus]|nr:hypothetical protein PM082_004592 [Marasmius tenuissimus]
MHGFHHPASGGGAGLDAIRPYWVPVVAGARESCNASDPTPISTRSWDLWKGRSLVPSVDRRFLYVAEREAYMVDGTRDPSRWLEEVSPRQSIREHDGLWYST